MNEGQREMIFSCCRVELIVIYAHSPPRDDSLDQLIFTILNNCHSSLLWHNLNGAHPLTMWHRIDYPGVQKLENLFLDNLSHLIIDAEAP
jgi:hypothetical protein